jgi:hypothetical protein
MYLVFSPNHFCLKSAGCPVDLVSQISCEMCQAGQRVEHAGGYDEKYNQVKGILFLGNCLVIKGLCRMGK